MTFETTVEEFEPFDDDMTVEVTHEPFFTKLALTSHMPDGFVDRVKEDDLEIKDVNYLGWVVDEHTNQSLDEMLEAGEGRKAAYIIGLVLHTVTDNEMPSWEEFNEKSSFIKAESLGVR